MESSWEGSFLNLLGTHDLRALAERLRGYQTICITGASGWIGKESSDLLLSALGDEFYKRVTLVTSDGRNVVLRAGTVPSIPWDSFVVNGNFDLILHFAFLNQDKIRSFGQSKFLEINRKITADVLSVASRNQSGDLLCASSGAAGSYSSNLHSNVSYEIYAGIKHEMESLFNASGFFRNLILMRIWSISGIYADLDAPYAFSSFVSQGMRSDLIQITGPAKSLRTYVNTQEMIWVYIMALGYVDSHIVDSGGFTISMFELANLVSSHFGNKSVISRPENSYSLVNYTPNSSVFNSLASSFSLELSTVKEQVELVIEFHSKSFGIADNC